MANTVTMLVFLFLFLFLPYTFLLLFGQCHSWGSSHGSTLPGWNFSWIHTILLTRQNITTGLNYLLLVLRFVPLLVFAFVPKEGPSVNLLAILVGTCMEDRCLGSRALLRAVPRRIAAKGIEPPYCYSVSAGLMNCLVAWAWVMQWWVYMQGLVSICPRRFICSELNHLNCCHLLCHTLKKEISMLFGALLSP